jgi:hypothetical protein
MPARYTLCACYTLCAHCISTEWQKNSVSSYKDNCGVLCSKHILRILFEKKRIGCKVRVNDGDPHIKYDCRRSPFLIKCPNIVENSIMKNWKNTPLIIAKKEILLFCTRLGCSQHMVRLFMPQTFTYIATNF